MNAETTIGTSSCVVLEYPKDRIKRVNTVPQFNEDLLERKTQFISLLVEKYVNSLLNKLSMEGVEVSDPKCVTDFVFIFEVVKSALNRAYGIEHPLQEFVDMNFGNAVNEVLQDIPENITAIDLVEDYENQSEGEDE